MDKVGEIYVYIVRPGDYLGHIAKQFNTTIKLICDLNDLDEDAILQIGQQLLIPVLWTRSYSPMPAFYF